MSNASSGHTRPGMNIRALAPVMISFFIMGFVDLVGIAANYVKDDFSLTDSQANLFTSMVFFWFLIFSVPTGLLMNRIGRRRTVLISIIVTSAALIVPVIGYMQPSKDVRFILMIISFCLLGIGNTLMQVSLNPLLSNLVSDDKLASTLTLGQFVKAIASFIAPILAGWMATAFGMWWLLYVIFLVVAIVGYALLAADHIEEAAPDKGKTSIARCFALLKDPVVLLCFLGIVSHVGIDVGINTTAPKILMEQTGQSLSTAGIATSVYFVFRTIGCLTGSVTLQRLSNKTALRICAVMMTLSVVCFTVFITVSQSPVFLCYLGLALVGFGNSNVFSLFLTRGLLHMPSRQNEISGLMMMGLIGGAIFPPLMGLASDAVGMQTGAIAVMSVGVVYVLVIAIFHGLIVSKNEKVNPAD
ncbi:MFS transporter [Bifidobacterium psychraerophilum]|uniref:MFS transporter n=1 Tax=Bifidobacterium psychraerophilum TaxID=218140 RepID=UPI0023F3DFC0|nr:MFS transporter [Bifidobacterium psychraerophilum]MCI1804253.1 MFS transporter [Bifidobacterium psychraerophilum]MCI2176700.1 MFS transporter [Bifidobacterium psychraerophilum]MCI2181489.1 MFS transporter [Bifidobacterium psychraerophilum]